VIRRAAVLIAAAGLALAPLPAAAHRGHAALSVVEINGKTGDVTVSHRIPAHDAEPALAVIAPDAQTSLDDPEAIAALKAYMLKQFCVAIDGKIVELTLKDLTLGPRSTAAATASPTTCRPAPARSPTPCATSPRSRSTCRAMSACAATPTSPS
jgi:hypothetical protein